MEEGSRIAQAAISGFSWNIAGNLARSLGGFFINILLARILGPEPFGVVALALLIIGIGNLIIDSGLSAALIQKENISEKDVVFVFTIQMIFGTLLTLLLIGIAPWIAKQFLTPESASVLRIMSLMLIFQSFAQVPNALLRRSFNFKKLQIAQIISFFVGFLGVGFPMALAGTGVWSLVAAQLIQSGLNALLLFLFSRHPLIFTLNGSSQLLSFGIRVLGANIANWLIQYLDQIFVGRQFGPQNLGYYNRAYFLGSTPANIVLTSAQTSLLSATSRMGKSKELQIFFKKTMNLFALIFFPTYCLVALESDSIIRFIYGEKWLPAANVLTPLAIAFPLYMLMGLQGPILNGLGYPGIETRIQWFTLVFSFAVLLVASHISLTAVGWSISLVSLLRYLLLSYITSNILNLSRKEMFYPLALGLLLVSVISAIRSISFLILPKEALFVRLSFTFIATILLVWIGKNWFIRKLIKL
ncbi:MAG: lipopolysaccharide biosynthesis protein [Anaerolineales bacterium]